MGAGPIPNSSLWGSELFNGPASGAPPGPPQGGVIVVEDLIYHALRIAGVLTVAGRTRSQDEFNDSFFELNSMIDDWKTERMMIRVILRTMFQIHAGQQLYSIGTDTTSGQPDFFIERPQEIVGAGYLFTTVTPNNEVPIRILVDQEYRAVSPKDLQSSFPIMLYYFPAVPNGVIQFYPVPNQEGLITLYTWQTLQEFTAATESFVAPPGYRSGLIWALAERLWQRFPRSVLGPDRIQEMRLKAQEFKEKIKALNAPHYLMQCDRGLIGRRQGGSWNVFSNRYNP